MAASTRIVYGQESIGGKILAEGIGFQIQAQNCFDRAKALADSVTAGGVTKGNLQTATEFGTVVSGADLYDAIANIKANAATVTAAALAQLDMG